MRIELPNALRNLIRVIKVATSKLEGDITSVAVSDIDFSESWVILPPNVLVDGTPEGAARILMVYANDTTRVICQAAQAGAHWHKKVITDAHEFIQVQEGRLLEFVTGTIIEPGSPLLVPAGQVTEYIALEDTFFTDTVTLASPTSKPTDILSPPAPLLRHQAPAGRQKLLEKIRLTSSLIEGGENYIAVRDIPLNYEWSQTPTELLTGGMGEAKVRVVHDEPEIRIYVQFLGKGTALGKSIIPDACERVTVALGSVLDMATGKVITPGNDLLVPAGQVNQYFAQEDSVFVVAFKFI